MSTFITTVRPTPFGFYDSSAAYQKDADKIVFFVLRKHGEDILSTELTKKMIWTCFEQAVFTFNAQVIEYQTKANLASLLGMPTGSYVSGSENTATLSINLVNNYLRPNLEFLLRQAEAYIGEIGFGQNVESMSGSVLVREGQQDYDLLSDLQDAAGTPLANYMNTGSRGRMKVVEVFHHAPAQYIFNSNLASSFVASGLPMETYVPDTRFHILPVFEDVLRAGVLKDAQKVRRSHYRYKITGRNIRFYPVPRELVGGAENRIWIRVAYPQSPAPGIVDVVSGSLRATDDTLYGVSNPANAPFGLINYDTINPWAKNWIFEYTFALCTELLGRVRSKFKSIPIPGAELTLNGDDLVQQGREDKDKLLYGDNGLMAKLASLTYDKLAELEANKAELQLKQLSMIPMPPGANISMG
jgi:hypothetical protein